MAGSKAPAGQMIRWAFGIEAVLNTACAIPFLFFPVRTLKAISHAAVEPDGLSITIIQWFGGAFLILTPQLVTTLPDTTACIHQRPLAYETLLAGEVVIMPILLWQLTTRTEAERGVSDEFLLQTVLFFLPIMAWRILLLFFKPHWFGNANAPGKAHGKTA